MPETTPSGHAPCETPYLILDVTLPLARFELRVRAALGARVAIVGPSGAGKTSLVEAIAGLRPARGRIVVGGEVLLDAGIDRPPERRRVGYVPQHGALFPHLSVRRNLLFGRRDAPGDAPGDASGQRVETKVEQLIETKLERLVDTLDLAPLLDRMPANLSGGEQRRVAIGRALLSAPRLLLVDEPTAGLDPRRARRTLACLRETTRASGVPLVVVTHRDEEALALADEALVLDEGCVVSSGPARDVLSRRTGDDASPPVNVVAGRVERLDESDGTAEVRLDDGELVAVAWSRELSAGRELVLAVGSEEVLVAVEEPRGLSARNVIVGAVDEVVHAGDRGGVADVRVGRWTARLTRAAARELALEPGRRAWLVVKSHAWRIVAG